jgi:signal peptidase I
MKRIKLKWKPLFKEFFFWLVVVVIAIALAVSMRVFLFASFKIPTPSMEPAILPGDYIIVNKQIPGPRVYSHFPKVRIDGKVVTKRFQGIRAIRRNDILVFNFPYHAGWDKIDKDLSVNYVKRCVAIPGDTFYIENGIYKVRNCTNILGNREAQLAFSKRKPEDIPPEIFRCFPHDSIYDWNVKSFGPLYVPKKGDTIRINSTNILLYRNPIRYETGKEIPENLQTYVFQQNYYFMAGDLVSDSRDSRYWGLLPEDHIIGKAVLVWKSVEPETGKIRWKRIFNTM